MPEPFVVDPYLTGIAIAYQNGQLIADDVMPRITVGKDTYKYSAYTMGEEFSVPNTQIGRRGHVNQVEFTGTESTGSVTDYGIESVVPQRDIDTAPPSFRPLDRAVKKVTDIVMLGREVRVAGKVFNAANYGSANKITLSGTDQWSDENSDPIATITAGLDACMQRPNTLIFGRSSWSSLRQNPKIVKAVNRSAGDAGLVARQSVADLFEVNKVLVGESFLNTAKPGQTVALSRVWGKHCAALFINPLADAESGITWGWTAQFGQRIAGTRPEPNVGLLGGVAVRAGEMVEERIIAADTGYFIQNATA